MGSSRARNSTRAAKARFVKQSSRSARHRATSRQPSLPDIGRQLLEVRERLELVKARAYVCAKAVGEDSDDDDDIATVLQHDVVEEIDRQLEVLNRIAARIKGGRS